MSSELMKEMMMISARIRVYLLIALLVVSTSLAKELGTASPEEVGISSVRLQRINKVVQQYVDEGRIAGVVTLVARKGKIVHHEAFGMIDIEDNRPMSKDGMFRIASMSKPITCVGVMILYEQGQFLLNGPVLKYIPEFANPKVIVRTGSSKALKTEPARKEITIRHLLNHTSGLTYGAGPHSRLYKEAGIATGLDPTEGTIGEMVKKLANIPLISHPGEAIHYSLSIDVLGYL
ncbi:MAG: serine hydrolase domain-containing protein, partial [Sedimentisphaerales bacterium]